MPTYVTLYKWTKQGLANVKSCPERFKAARAMAEARGDRVIGIWVALGEYDMVAVSETKDELDAAAGALTHAMAGNVTTQTLRAFSEDEFAQIVAKLP
jgi:uncharacterized protein with GYD domain